MTDNYNHQQDLLAREIRSALDDFDLSDMSREEVSAVLEKEAIGVEFGSPETRPWLEGLEAEPDDV